MHFQNRFSIAPLCATTGYEAFFATVEIVELFVVFKHNLDILPQNMTHFISQKKKKNIIIMPLSGTMLFLSIFIFK